MSAAALQLGPVGRLGRYAATHTRQVAIAWVVLAVGLGFLAPRVETALSGAGWEATGSQSVAARSLIQKHFAGNASTGLMIVLHSPSRTAADPAFTQVARSVEALVKSDPAVAERHATSSRRIDQPRRAHGDRDGRRRAQPEADGARGRPPQGSAEEARHHCRVRQPDRRVRACGRTSTPPTAPR